MWLQGKIKGHQVRIEETIENWLQNLYSNKPRFTKGFTSRFYQVRQSNVAADAVEGLEMESGNEEFLPIQIVLNHNGAFEKFNVIWDYNESVITPEMMAKIIVEDNGLPVSYEAEIIYSMKKVIEAHKKFTHHFDPNFEENICTIELSISDNGVTLVDRFEWDLYEELNDPAEFARVLVVDMGLPQSFENMVSFEIHRQIYNYKKFLSQSNANLGYETYTRQKKIRGIKENNFGRLPDLMRKDVIIEQNCLRPVHVLSDWTPDVKFTNA